MASGDLSQARAQAEAILAGRHQSGGHAILAGALSVIAVVAWSEGRLSDALSLLDAAMHRAELGPREPRRLQLRLGTSLIHTALGDFEVAETMIAEARQELESLRDGQWAAGPAVMSSCLHLAAGRIDRAGVEARIGLRLCDERAARFFVPPGCRVLAEIALMQGDLDSAARHVERFKRETPSNPGGISHGAYIWTEARLADARGQWRRAGELTGEIVDRLRVHQRLLVDEPAAAAWLVRSTLAVDDRWRAEAVVVCADQMAACNPRVPSLDAAARHARGLLDRDPASVAHAAVTYRHPWACGSAHEDAGRLLADRGQSHPAAVHFDQALEAYRQTGAERDGSRLSEKVPRRGRYRLHRRQRPVLGWASLTDTERRVAQVVADGLTNAEAAGELYVSRHTVDFHLRQIFRKLGIRSRVALTRIVIDRIGAARQRRGA